MAHPTSWQVAALRPPSRDRGCPDVRPCGLWESLSCPQWDSLEGRVYETVYGAPVQGKSRAR
jgi:hypothetical protein